MLQILQGGLYAVSGFDIISGQDLRAFTTGVIAARWGSQSLAGARYIPAGS
jgi:hypothetical protein